MISAVGATPFRFTLVVVVVDVVFDDPFLCTSLGMGEEDGRCSIFKARPEGLGDEAYKFPCFTSVGFGRGWDEDGKVSSIPSRLSSLPILQNYPTVLGPKDLSEIDKVRPAYKEE